MKQLTTQTVQVFLQSLVLHVPDCSTHPVSNTEYTTKPAPSRSLAPSLSDMGTFTVDRSAACGHIAAVSLLTHAPNNSNTYGVMSLRFRRMPWRQAAHSRSWASELRCPTFFEGVNDLLAEL